MKTEQLYTCPVCHQPGFLLAGLRQHRCKAKSRRRMTPNGPLQHPQLTEAELSLAIKQHDLKS